MSFSFRIFLGFFLVIGFAAYLFFFTLIQELKPGFRQSTEESLVDIANLLAELIVNDLITDTINDGQFSQAVTAFQNRKLNAKIWNLTKRSPSLKIYITDARGIVVYDSNGAHVGEDFSNWNDVYLTLRGEYGVRSTLADPSDELSSVMHVAAPVRYQNNIIGVVTVRKPGISVQPFFTAAQANLRHTGAILLLFSLLAGALLSLWLSRSVRQLADYAHAVSGGKTINPPEVHGKELRQLANAMATMKEELEGKKYIEHYIHTLAHQLKTPIASIQGASELLNEEMTAEQRQRFVKNIRNESDRLLQIVQYMLSLAAMENRRQLGAKQRIAVYPLLQEIIHTQQAMLDVNALHIKIQVAKNVSVQGDLFLLQQALSNLLDNAISFSPEGGEISISCKQSPSTVTLKISDTGPGIPEFALGQIFERFYSLPRPGSTHKSSGLGLCFVKEISRLHDGDIRLINIHPHGVTAIFRLPA